MSEIIVDGRHENLPVCKRQYIVVDVEHGILDIELTGNIINVVLTMEKAEQYVGTIHDCTDGNTSFANDGKSHFNLLVDEDYELNLNRKTIKGLGFTITLTDSKIPKNEIKLLAAEIMSQRLGRELDMAINEMKRNSRNQDTKIATEIRRHFQMAGVIMSVLILNVYFVSKMF
jgi:hypothetical protein